ncbi:hypothetical protein S83_012201, partial [Arachis hypogaea]
SLCRVEQKESVRSSVSMVKDFPDLGRRMQEQRQLLHLLEFRLWHPTSLNFMQNVVNENQSPILAVTEECQ